mgnify:CR=1 FL=1
MLECHVETLGRRLGRVFGHLILLEKLEKSNKNLDSKVPKHRANGLMFKLFMGSILTKKARLPCCTWVLRLVRKIWENPTTFHLMYCWRSQLSHGILLIDRTFGK